MTLRKLYQTVNLGVVDAFRCAAAINGRFMTNCGASKIVGVQEIEFVKHG